MTRCFSSSRMRPLRLLALAPAVLACACAGNSDYGDPYEFGAHDGSAQVAPARGDAQAPAQGTAQGDAGSNAGGSTGGGKPTTTTTDPGRVNPPSSGFDAGATSPEEPDASDPPSSSDAGSSPDATTTTRDASVSDAGGRDASANDASAPGTGAKFVGNITTNGQVRSDFASMWNQITPENEGKWGSVEATRNQMSWTGLDRVHDYAKQHNVLFKQHTLVWGSQQPSWLNGLSAADQAKEVEEWIRLFCERYPDVALIDVVNEPPPHTTPVYMNALGGAGKSGYDWIVKAFQWAHQYCPNAKLILNDYNNIEYSADNTRFINIAKAVKQAGAPIHAVGAQAHDAFKLSTSSVQQMIDKIASETGLPVYITEYDLDLADDTKQRQVMESQFTMFWQDQNVKGITLWGYISGATWRPNTGLMSQGGTPRPALTWLLDFLKNKR